MDLLGEGTALAARLAAAEWPFLVAGVGFHVLRRASRARAWQQMVIALDRGGEVRFRDALAVCLAAVGISSVAPLRGCELLRVVLIRRRLPGVSYAALSATLVLEALLDLVAAGLLVGAAFVFGVVPALAGGGAQLGIPAVAGLARQTVVSTVAELRRTGVLLTRRRLLLCRVVPWQGISWLLRMIAIACFLEAFSIEPSPTAVLAVLAVQLVAGALPLSWLAIGAEQALYALALAPGASGVQAITFGLGMHAATTLANAALGLPALALVAPGIGIRRLLREARNGRAVPSPTCAGGACACGACAVVPLDA